MKNKINFKELSYFAILFVVTFLLSSSTFIILKKSITFPADAVNTISITFTYLSREGDLTIKAYDQNNIIQKEARRTIELKKFSINDSDDDVNRQVVNFEDYEIDIPILSSHRIELELDTGDNYAYINSIKINNKIVSLDKFIQEAKSRSKLKIGRFKDGTSQGIIIGSDESNITIDVTSVLEPVKITTEELEQIQKDQSLYTILIKSFLFLAIFVLFYVISIVFRNYCNEYVRQKYILILLFLAIITSITTSYYILFEDVLINNYKALTFNASVTDFLRKLNILTFFQNFLPLICTSAFIAFLSFITKNRVIKACLLLIPLSIFVILLIDNCLLSVLSVRLNFNMSGHATETKYFKDFIYSYLIADSGFLMSLGVCTFIISAISSFFITINKISFKNLSTFSTPLIALVIWGFYPTNSESFDFKFLNPLQVNGFCFQKIGNFYNTYSDEYELRNKLKISYKTEEGLNQNRNVILLLVESWGCNFTYICGIGPSKMPYTETLAKTGLFFDNYYSIMPSTSISLLSMIKSVPVIHNAWGIPETLLKHHDTNSLNITYDDSIYSHSQWLYEQNDLIRAFKNNGYKTSFISSTDLVFGMNETVEQTNFDEIIDAQSPMFKNIKERFIFDSVNDEELFKYIIKKIQSEDNKFFYVTKTATNHNPFNSPLGFNNLDKAFEYTDYEVFKFVKQLEKINYFKDGILVLLGDHHAWGHDGSERNNDDPTYVNKVPLIIIDGEHKNEVNHTQFSHSSLGVMLQYLELPTYKYNQFNVNPLVNELNSEVIYGYDFSAMTFLEVKKGDRKGTIILNGDDSSFRNDDVFTKEEMDEILGYVAYFRR